MCFLLSIPYRSLRSGVAGNHSWGRNYPLYCPSPPYTLHSLFKPVIHANSVTKIGNTVYLLCSEAFKSLSGMSGKKSGKISQLHVHIRERERWQAETSKDSLALSSPHSICVPRLIIVLLGKGTRHCVVCIESRC